MVFGGLISGFFGMPCAVSLSTLRSMFAYSFGLVVCEFIETPSGFLTQTITSTSSLAASTWHLVWLREGILPRKNSPQLECISVL